MACRDLKRAEAARTQLYDLLDEHIATIPTSSTTYRYAAEFRRKVQLDIHRLDLSATRSVLQFGKEVSQKYPYISHLICNAGVATYSHLDLLVFFRQCLESPLLTIRHPAFNIQKVGVMSNDNLGFVWQCNVFGHYVLFRSLQSLLSKYTAHTRGASGPVPSPARVLWMSSVDALPTYDPDSDPQLTKTDASYQASKSQIDLMTMELARRRAKSIPEAKDDIVHVLVSPGITATKMAAELLKPVFLEWLMLMFFYVCRSLGSPHVLFSTYKAAVAATHLSLVSLGHVPASMDEDKSTKDIERYPKFSAQNDRWGRESVGVEPVVRWLDHPDEGAQILDRCERLYQTFVEAEGKDGIREEGS